ncbi:SusD family protein [compost metagenome]
MKKIKLFLVLTVGALLFSCEDAYRIEQDGEFGEDVTFLSVKDMEDYLMETYDKVNIHDEIALTSYFTDEVAIGNANAGQNVELYNFVLNNRDGLASGIWLTHYTLINYANRVLRGASRVTPDAGDPAEVARYNSIIAQAKALRAFGHFQLLTYFSEDIKNPASLGVILLDRVPATSEKLPRSTTGEVFALIESDLAASENVPVVLPTLPAAARPYHFINPNFFKAFRARMYAYKGEYGLAAQYANDLIATSGVSLSVAWTGTPPPNGATFPAAFYGTSSPSPYRRMFNDQEQGEVLFALGRPAGKGTIADIFYTNRTNLSGAVLHDMSRSLFGLLGRSGDRNTDNSDIRGRAFLDPTTIAMVNPLDPAVDYIANDVLCIDKYPGKTGADLTNDLKVFRISEMYFIRAEAFASTGNLNGATNSVASVLKQIRDVRNYRNIAQPLPVYASPAEAWADILKERRLELCYEGHRYVDLRRLGPLANVTIDRFSRDCNVATGCDLPLTDHKLKYLPIPQNEIIGNPTIKQNLGY